MKISSVYIVKNEAQNIEKSINSIKNICDEIIIVDTGSSDDTVQICESLGCKIYHYKWENDFSKARNYAISLCSNEIIIFLDADEYFTNALNIEDKQKIENYFLKDIDVIGCFEIDIEKSTGEQHHTSYVYKIIKNHLQYKGTIHENLINPQRELRIHLTDEIQLIHTGYSSEVSRSKVERNLEILNQIKNKNTMDYFYLGRENLSLQNYEQADENFKLFFESQDYEKQIKTNNIAYLSYIYKLNVMENLPNKYSDADILQHLLEAKAKIPHIPEIYFCLGMYYFDKDFKKSLEYFEETIKKNEEFTNKHFELNNFLGYQDKIYANRSKILLYMDKKNEAIQKAIVACMLNKKDKNNLGLLLHLLNRQKTKENIELLNRIYKPNSKKDYEFIVKMLENTNLYTEFLTYSLAYNQEYQGGADSLYYAMMLNGDYKAALDSLIKFDNDKRNFIMAVILLYANDSDLLAEYFEYLPEEYINILQTLIYQDFTQLTNLDLLVDVICKLIVYGVKGIQKSTWEYLLTHITPEQIVRIAKIYNNNQDYGFAFELLSYCIYNLQIYSDAIIKEYLFTIFIFKQYPEANENRYEYFIKEYNYLFNLLTKKDICVSYLKLIRDKIIKKSYATMKKKLIKEIENYAKGK